MLLKDLAKNAKTAIEIGFNAGHSADIILSANPEIKLTSFDIGDHEYIKHAKRYIDFLHPTRHNLVIGDSAITIPKFIESNACADFDLLFIDGDHSYEGALRDLKNCLQMAHDKSIIIMDDTIYKPEWTKSYSIGPTQAWIDAINQGFIVNSLQYTFDELNGISYGYKGPNA